jgi:hypothetical protein
MEMTARLALSIAEIQHEEKASTCKEKKKADDTHSLLNIAPAAVERLRNNGGDCDKLVTKNQMCAILFAAYGDYIDHAKSKKPSLIVKILQDNMERDAGTKLDQLQPPQADPNVYNGDF